VSPPARSHRLPERFPRFFLGLGICSRWPGGEPSTLDPIKDSLRKKGGDKAQVVEITAGIRFNWRSRGMRLRRLHTSC
jgi:hypothetical protein